MTIEDIYSVDLISGPIWVTKDVFYQVEQKLFAAKELSRDQYMSELIQFNSISGTYHNSNLHSIIGLSHSTKENRKKMMELSQSYQTEFMNPFVQDKNAQTS